MKAHVNGIDLFYIDEGSGDSIIFIHGLGENADSWNYQIEHFKKTYRIIVPDLRGHHRSDDGKVTITMGLFAKDVIGLMEYLNIEKAHFVGLSMGGLILQELTKYIQPRIISLSICNSAAYASEESKKKLDGRLKKIEESSMDEMAEFIVNACLPYKYDPEVYKKAFDVFRLNRKKPYSQSTIATFSVDFRKDLKNIRLPTLVMTGEFDQATPIAEGKYIHERIEGSVFKVIKGVGHLSKLEKPAEFNHNIEQFIESLSK